LIAHHIDVINTTIIVAADVDKLGCERATVGEKGAAHIKLKLKLNANAITIGFNPNQKNNEQHCHDSRCTQQHQTCTNFVVVDTHIIDTHPNNHATQRNNERTKNSDIYSCEKTNLHSAGRKWMQYSEADAM
jgi:hypothetical protein